MVIPSEPSHLPQISFGGFRPRTISSSSFLVWGNFLKHPESYHHRLLGWHWVLAMIKVEVELDMCDVCVCLWLWACVVTDADLTQSVALVQKYHTLTSIHVNAVRNDENFFSKRLSNPQYVWAWWDRRNQVPVFYDSFMKLSAVSDGLHKRPALWTQSPIKPQREPCYLAGFLSESKGKTKMQTSQKSRLNWLWPHRCTVTAANDGLLNDWHTTFPLEPSNLSFHEKRGSASCVSIALSAYGA